MTWPRAILAALGVLALMLAAEFAPLPLAIVLLALVVVLALTPREVRRG